MFIFTVRDAKAEAYMQPFFGRSKGEAIRAIQTEVNSGKQDNMLASYPEDFNLFYIGEFNEQTGEIILPEGGAVNLGNAANFKTLNG